MGEREALNIDDRTSHQSPQVPSVGFFVVLQEIGTRENIVVDEEDVAAFSLLDGKIASGRRPPSIPVEGSQAISNLEFL